VVLMLVASSGLFARILRHETFKECPDIGFAQWFSDEGKGGAVYLLVVDCSGKSCLTPFTGPVQSDGRIQPPAMPIDLPDDWRKDIADAATITAYGAALPIHFTDADGNVYRGRNPYDAVEAAELQARANFLRDIGGMPPVQSNVRPTDYATVNLMHGTWVEYFNAVYRTDEEQDAHPGELGRGHRLIEDNRSAMVIRAYPSPANGQTLAIAPILPPFAGRAVIVASDGRIVWQGDVAGETTVDMAGQPGGTYFVTSLGKALVVNIVR